MLSLSTHPLLAFSLVGPAFLGLVLAAAGGIFSRRAYLLYRLVRLGRPASRFDDLPKRIEQEATVVLGQRKLLQRLGPGLMHAFIFWGFLVLLTTIVEALGEVFTKTFAIPLIGRTGWLGLIQDVFTVLVVAGIEMAVYIRKVQRPERFKGSHLEEADFILLMIMGIVLTLLALNGARIALGINESLRVSELVVPASLTVLTAPEETVVSVVTPQILKVEEAAPAEEAAEEGAAEEGAEEAPAKESGEAEG